PETGLVGTGPGRLVAGDGQKRADGPQGWKNQARRSRRDRALGADARERISRRPRAGDPASHSVERSAHERRMRRDRVASRRTHATDRDGRHPRPDRIYGPQNSLAAKARAQALRAYKAGAAA